MNDVQEFASVLRYAAFGEDEGVVTGSPRAPSAPLLDALERVVERQGEALLEHLVGPATAPEAHARVLAHCLRADDDQVRSHARRALPRLCGPDGELVLRLVRHLDELGGWGRGIRRAVATWYEHRPEAELVQAVLQCAEVEGWSHRDVLRLVHARAQDSTRNATFHWITRGAWPEAFAPVDSDDLSPDALVDAPAPRTWVAMDTSGTMARRSPSGEAKSAIEIAAETSMELLRASKQPRLFGYIADGWTPGPDPRGRHAALSEIPETAWTDRLVEHLSAARMSAPDPALLVQRAAADGAKVDLLVVFSTVFTRDDRERAIAALDAARAALQHPVRLALVGLLAPVEPETSPPHVLEVVGCVPRLGQMLRRFGRFSSTAF